LLQFPAFSIILNIGIGADISAPALCGQNLAFAGFQAVLGKSTRHRGRGPAGLVPHGFQFFMDDAAPLIGTS
jgi:hypothetical protein